MANEEKTKPIITQKTANSIDDAITTCENKIKHHRVSGQTVFLCLGLTLILFIVIHYLMLKVNEEKSKTVTQFKTEINRLSNTIKSSVKTDMKLYKELIRNEEITMHLKENLLDDLHRLKRDLNFTINDNDIGGIGEFIAIRDTITANDTTYVATMEKFTSLPDKIVDSFVNFPDALFYFVYAIFILVFGVLTSFYRFHLKEISKYEHFLFGFHRIRIAGNNADSKFNDEVKVALTNNAFSVENRPIFKGKMESPIPGHPSSDAFTILLNKVMEKLDTFSIKKDEEKKQEKGR